MSTTSTGIEWCTATWSPLVGCSKVSAGCKHCYAETMGKRLRAMAIADIEAGRNPGRKRHYIDAVDERGRWSGRFVLVPEALAEPLGWRKPRRVFVNSMSDLFGEAVPDEYIAAVFGVMAACPQHTFQVLTKRPERAAAWFRWMEDFRHGPDGEEGPLGAMSYSLCCSDASLPESWDDEIGPPVGDEWPLPNVHLLTSVEDQSSADQRIPWLFQCPAAVHGVSYEPAIGPVDFTRLTMVAPKPPHGPGVWLNALTGHVAGPDDVLPARLGWVVVGGESGPGARPFDVAWARSVIRQCREAGVACFVKQFGAHCRETYEGGDDSSQGRGDRVPHDGAGRQRHPRRPHGRAEEAMSETTTPTGAERIAAERHRQVVGEGWTPSHDDEHNNGDLAWAAACYAAPAPIMAIAPMPIWCGCRSVGECMHNGPIGWGEPDQGDPWPIGWDDKRPSPDAPRAVRIRALVKAGALIAAEIDRLQRLEDA